MLIVSFLSGMTASLGIGGGMVLLLYLTAINGVPQLQAQGINLVFFIPIALISLIIHSKNKLVEWKKIVPAIITGTISALIFSSLADSFGSEIIQKLFAILLIINGIKELLYKEKKTNSHTSK